MRNAVVIVGSGMMGAGIAARSAAAGRRTILVDTCLERAQRGVDAALGHIDQLCARQLIDQPARLAARGLLEPCDALDGALAQADMVIEAIVENLEAKQALFAQMDAILPAEVPVMSNSSGLQITRIAERCAHAERTMIAHFWFPAHLVPLVELVVGECTDIRFVEAMREELLRWGKAPVIVKRDLPGQLANRILQAVIREAVHIVEMGLATPEDVDTAIKMGMGIRLPVWGPLEHIDAVGLDLGLSVQDCVLPEISAAREGAPILREMVENNHLGVKTGQGFYDWSQKDIGALQNLRDDFIITAVKFMQQRR